jgi:hypothetical protein
MLALFVPPSTPQGSNFPYASPPSSRKPRSNPLRQHDLKFGAPAQKSWLDDQASGPLVDTGVAQFDLEQKLEASHHASSEMRTPLSM